MIGRNEELLEARLEIRNYLARDLNECILNAYRAARIANIRAVESELKKARTYADKDHLDAEILPNVIKDIKRIYEKIAGDIL